MIFGRIWLVLQSKITFSQKTTNRNQYFLIFLRYNSNISPFFRPKNRHICIKFYVIILSTIFMKNNFNLTCQNMLKYVKNTKIWTFYSIFSTKQLKYPTPLGVDWIPRGKILAIDQICYIANLIVLKIKKDTISYEKSED